MKKIILMAVLFSSVGSLAYDGVIVRCGRLNGVILTNVNIKREIADAGTPRVRFIDSLESNITMIDRALVTPVVSGHVNSRVEKDSVVYQGEKFSLEVRYDYNTFKLVDEFGAYTVEGVARFDIKSGNKPSESYELDCTKYDHM